jgi:hypothetical protein
MMTFFSRGFLSFIPFLHYGVYEISSRGMSRLKNIGFVVVAALKGAAQGVHSVHAIKT